MTITIYTMPVCPQCDRTKDVLIKAGVGYVEESMESLKAGHIPDFDALAEAGRHGWKAPLLMRGDRAVKLSEIV